MFEGFKENIVGDYAKILVCVLGDFRVIKGHFFFLVLSFGNWEDPPPPCWEKFPNNPVFFF